MDIDKILYYGRFYRDEFSIESEWWFCKLDNQVYSTIDLMNTFGYKTKQEIVGTKVYICLFKTDIIAAKKLFLSERGVTKYINLSDADFDIQFNKFIDEFSLHKQWFDFEYLILKKDAIQWCLANHII